MQTTIAVKKETLDMLKHARQEMGLSSNEEVIRKLLLNSKKPQKSMFGKFKNLKEFKRDEIDRFD